MEPFFIPFDLVLEGLEPLLQDLEPVGTDRLDLDAVNLGGLLATERLTSRISTWLGWIVRVPTVFVGSNAMTSTSCVQASGLSVRLDPRDRHGRRVRIYLVWDILPRRRHATTGVVAGVATELPDLLLGGLEFLERRFPSSP